MVKRGHRLITDDVVELRKISDELLVGTAPDLTRHLIELRGIGIIDVRQLFGMSAGGLVFAAVLALAEGLIRGLL